MYGIGKKSIEFLKVACNGPNNHPCQVAELCGRQRKGRHVVVGLISAGLLRSVGNGHYIATEKGREFLRRNT